MINLYLKCILQYNLLNFRQLRTYTYMFNVKIFSFSSWNKIFGFRIKKSIWVSAFILWYLHLNTTDHIHCRILFTIQWTLTNGEARWIWSVFTQQCQSKQLNTMWSCFRRTVQVNCTSSWFTFSPCRHNQAAPAVCRELALQKHLQCTDVFMCDVIRTIGITERQKLSYWVELMQIIVDFKLCVGFVDSNNNMKRLNLLFVEHEPVNNSQFTEYRDGQQVQISIRSELPPSTGNSISYVVTHGDLSFPRLP